MQFEPIHKTLEANEVALIRDNIPGDRAFFVTTPTGEKGLIEAAVFLSFFAPSNSAEEPEAKTKLDKPAAPSAAKKKAVKTGRPRKQGSSQDAVASAAPTADKAPPATPAGPSISTAIRAALANGPLRMDEIAKRVHAKHPNFSETQVSSNVYACRQGGFIQRTPGTVSGSDGTWELVKK